MVRVIGVFDGEGTERRKFRLNRIQPRRARRGVDRFHVTSQKKCRGGTHIGREIVHHDINTELHWIARPKMFETRYNIITCFAFAHAADQAITMYIIKAMQLFDAAFTRIGRPLPLRMSMACPARTCKGA